MLRQEGVGCFESLTFQKTQPGDSAKPTRHNQVSVRMKKTFQREQDFFEILPACLFSRLLLMTADGNKNNHIEHNAHYQM